LNVLVSSHALIVLMPSSNSAGFAQFYAKDPTITFAPTAHPSNYVTVISLAAAVPGAGFALIDMAKVVAAFDAGLTMLPDSAVDYVAAGPGDSIWTTIERGSDFAAIPIWNAAIGKCVSRPACIHAALPAPALSPSRLNFITIWLFEGTCPFDVWMCLFVCVQFGPRCRSQHSHAHSELSEHSWRHPRM
jgi:hypothetical protein